MNFSDIVTNLKALDLGDLRAYIDLAYDCDDLVQSRLA